MRYGAMPASLIRNVLDGYNPNPLCGSVVPLHAIRREKPPGLYSEVCEDNCPRSFHTCTLRPDQCPRALNEWVDVD